MMRVEFGLLLAAALGLAGVATAGEHGFSFWDAEFMPPDRAMAEAQAYVAQALPSGLPIDVALRRLRKASMSCRAPGAPGAPIICDCSEVVHLQGGILGEDHWTVVLTADASGRLASASLDHHIIGAGPPNIQ